MLDSRFIYLALIVDLAGAAAYALDTLKGKTKPNRVTWLLWMLAPMIGFFAQVSEGVGLPALLTFIIGFGPLLVLVASLANKKAYWQITKFDIGCGALSLVALALWAITSTGLIAITLSIAADLFAGIPTIVKGYRQPGTESYNAYLAGIFSAGLTLLTVKVWNFATYGFPVYLIVSCIIMFVLVKFPHLRPVRQKAQI